MTRMALNQLRAEISSIFHIILPQVSIYIFDWYASIQKLSHHIKLSCEKVQHLQ